MDLGMVSSDGLELNSSGSLRCDGENREKDREVEEKLGFGGGVEAFYRRGGVGGFMWRVRTPTVDRVSAGSPPSCLHPEVEDGEG
jgi:hypothetical protein